MATVRLEEFQDGLVLYFQTDDQSVNAYTLASTLVRLADAAKAANRVINPGYDIEVVVVALASGSFKTFVSAIYTGAGNLFSAESLKAVILSVVASFAFEAIHRPADPVKVTIETDEVIIERGQDRVVVPRNVYVASQQAQTNPQFTDAMSHLASTIASDSKVKALGFVPAPDSPAPEVLITRDDLQAYLPKTASHEPVQRALLEVCDLQIVKAILERSDRKWEFRWRGVKVSAPVSDQAFYSNFFAHSITIAPGDELRVRMKITQIRQPESEIFTNVDYEVVEVLQHTPKVRQMNVLDPQIEQQP